jgi:hypothetical protein
MAELTERKKYDWAETHMPFDLDNTLKMKSQTFTSFLPLPTTKTFTIITIITTTTIYKLFHSITIVT